MKKTERFSDLKKRHLIDLLFESGFRPQYVIRKLMNDLEITYSFAKNKVYKLVKDPEVLKAIKRRLRRMEITQERVVQELAALAFVDIADMFDEEGKIKNIKDVKEEVRKAIKSFESIRDEKKRTRRFAMHDKLKALELLGKYLGVFKEKVEVDTGPKLEEILLAARERAFKNNEDE